MARDIFDTGAAEIERARRLAEKRYNETLVALDQAVQAPPGALPSPADVDAAGLARLNQSWDVLAPAGGGAGALLRRLLAPVLRFAFGPQRAFNSAVVAHLNRQADVQRALLDALRQYIDGAIAFQSHVIWYVQTIAAFVDTRDGGTGTTPGLHALHAALNALADGWLKRWESLAAREARYAARHGELAASYGELKDLIALAQQNAVALKREVGRLAAGGPPPAVPATPTAASPTTASAAATSVDPAWLEALTYVGFEDRFRGSTDMIRERLRTYLPLVDGLSDVIELGCGRGEFLDLLRERGITARGVDLNAEMVEVTRGRGLDAVAGDALGYLRGQPDESAGAIFAAQVVEHLEPGYLVRLIEASARVLRPGGVVIFETINPACWAAFFDSYIRDLTHVRPLHPDTLQYLVRAAGLRDVRVEFRSPIPEADRLQPVPLPDGALDPLVADLVDAFNANMNRLNARLFTHLDYAVIGRK